ncbi:diguanylate cyclase regulator RdcB family protein [Psychrobacter sp. 72-O-c]|uniref:diguanylate cyclase regulator RdcB family protein n=1 Tax=Psychrobacter sp. 72-O-c TaxID=2774125 RepID=UPI001919AC50|nr:diguanylate cyclase regulator RdcB family protein [Psychrobacter sp. 72-O-c]
MELEKYQQSIAQNIPYLTDKMVIDFVNGLDTAKELNSKSLQPKSFVSRNLSLISGKTQRAQANVNDHLIAGLDACQHYFHEIFQSQQGHTHAIIEIHQTLKNTQLQTAELTHYVLDFQQQIEKQVDKVSSRLDRLESYGYAYTQMGNVLSKLKAEKFSKLSLLGQCYTTLDTLYWGDFGLYLRTYNDETKKEELLDTLENELIATFKQNLNIGAREDLHQDQWLCLPDEREESEVLQHALAYQGDWSQQAPNEYPIVFMATQYNDLPNDRKPEYKNISLNMIDIDRVTKRMIGEMTNRTEHSRLQGLGL